MRSDPSGEQRARCEGQTEQIGGDTYDSIRHVIAVPPVEVRIPFVLKDIPIPKRQQAAESTTARHKPQPTETAHAHDSQGDDDLAIVIADVV